MEESTIAALQAFVEAYDADSSILGDQKLRFFRNFLERLGARVPPTVSSAFSDSDDDMPELEEQAKAKPAEEKEDEIVESDVELDEEGVVSPDEDAPQKMGDPSIEVTEEVRDSAQSFKAQAMEALSEGKLEEAVEFFTEAILCNPSSALLYANRAGVYVKMKKPNAAIRDAEAAIEINPDSAKGHKWRGQAKALLGKWEDAAKDLHLASKLDYDEDIAAMLKKVEPNAHKLEEHRRKYDRLRKEQEAKRAEKERLRRKAEAQAAYEKAQQKPSRPAGGFPGGMPGFPGGMPGGMPGGFGGMPGMGGGMPGGMPAGMGKGMPGMGKGPGGIDMSKLLNDPELMSAFQDPEIMSALQDVMKNPANLAKHQSNPKLAPIINKMMSKMGSSGAV